MSSPKVVAVTPPDIKPIERMYIAKVNPHAFAIGLPVPTDLGAAADIFPGAASSRYAQWANAW